MARIDALLSGISDPVFTAVYQGEPLAISSTPVLAFWLTGQEVTAGTMTSQGTTTRLTVRAYFRMQVSPDIRESMEEDVWDAMTNIHSALVADIELNGHASDLRIGIAEAGFIEIGGNAFRTVSVPIEVDILEVITVAP